MELNCFLGIWLPIFLFALLHVSNYGIEVVEWFSPSALGILKKGLELIELQSINILRIIAITEIFILLIIPFSLLSFSFSGLALPVVIVVVYLKFLVCRYTSKQNPFTRIVFGELLEEIEVLCNKSFCPACVRNFLYTLMAPLTSRIVRSSKKEHFIRLEKPLLGKKRFISGL
ncbi:transmembrane protein 33-like [Daphnia carinata]|uniref:transmembrane protein 33-like n=1 Tax=Daphnia carinata TaxID=120202 RepID=UPI002868DE99|nr:transmembrane protein 33-like [Daphnia carinata]